MVKYSLEKIPNQILSITEGSHTYVIRFRTFNGILYADMTIDGTSVAKSVRCVPYGFIIPYPHMEVAGNFLMTSAENSYPSYKDFGETCNLYYLTADEVAWVRLKAKEASD